MNLRVLCVSLLATLLVGTHCMAHYLWVTTAPADQGQTVGNIYFEESPAAGDGSYLDHFLGKSKVWDRTLATPAPDPISASEVKQDGHRWMQVTLKAKKERSIDAYGKFGVYQYGDKKVLLHYYARNLQVQSHDAMHELGRAEQMELDLVPHQTGKEIEVTLLWKGKPVAERMVFIRGPAGFRKNVNTDERGRISVLPKASGQYTFRSSVEQATPGTENGEAYESVRHNITLVMSLDGTAPSSDKSSNDLSQGLPKRLLSEHLPNPVQVHSRVISGGLPADDAAFRELAELGVKTVISVDGAKPDVELAKKHGLRYVHLPHGYDGVPEQRVKELAKAVRDLPGTIYVHCHHGKHRSPAAASVACVAAGLVPATSAVHILDVAGTSVNYRGLYQSARQAKPIDGKQLDALKVQFQSTVEIPEMAEAMVGLGHTTEHLQWIEKSNWRSPSNHPDLDPAHEALLMQEHFTEMLRMPSVQSEPEDFQRMLKESETSAKSLHETLLHWKPESAKDPFPTSVTRHAKRIRDNCKACHVQYRDTPLGEK